MYGNLVGTEPKMKGVKILMSQTAGGGKEILNSLECEPGLGSSIPGQEGCGEKGQG